MLSKKDIEIVKELAKNEGFDVEHLNIEGQETLGDCIQCLILDFCSCWDKEENLLLIRHGLQLIEDRFVKYDLFELWQAKQIEIFGSLRSAAFFFYWTANKGYTEHGSSIPGWLTPEGADLLEALNIFAKQELEVK